MKCRQKISPLALLVGGCFALLSSACDDHAAKQRQLDEKLRRLGMTESQLDQAGRSQPTGTDPFSTPSLAQKSALTPRDPSLRPHPLAASEQNTSASYSTGHQRGVLRRGELTIAGTFTVESHAGESLFLPDKGAIVLRDTSGTVFAGTSAKGISSLDGTLAFPNGDLYQGHYEGLHLSGKGIYRSMQGTIYSGEWAHDEPDGPGTLWMADGTIVRGHFANGLLDGTGSVRAWDGVYTWGTFVGGTLTGFGARMYPDKTIERGAYQHGSLSGNGYETYRGGASYAGNFSLGVRQGKGVYSFPNGDKVVGEFDHGMPSMEHTYIHENHAVHPSSRTNGNRNKAREVIYLYEFMDGARTTVWN